MTHSLTQLFHEREDQSLDLKRPVQRQALIVIGSVTTEFERKKRVNAQAVMEADLASQ